MALHTTRLTRAIIHLDHLTHNLQLLGQVAGGVPLWPVVKADAYGHGAHIVAPHLVGLGCRVLGVADVAEAQALIDQCVVATFITLSATLPEHAEALVALGCEPVVCTRGMVEALAREARRQGRQVVLHLKVDTGMGRVGIHPDQVPGFLEYVRSFPELRVRGLMSHIPRADESDKAHPLEQIERFRQVTEVAEGYGIQVRHLANSAAILDLPGARFDAVRPGIAIYGLRPSHEIANPRVEELKPVLEWQSRITFLKEVPAGTGLSYGHSYRTRQPSLIATLPIGYGDGLDRNLSNGFDILVGGRRCPQVGRVTMDMTLVDVTALRGQVELGDEAVIIGRQGREEITADELAQKLGTINYEIVTRIGRRVARLAVGAESAA